jgi:hypothetical protein
MDRSWLSAAVAACGALLTCADAYAQGTTTRPVFATHSFGAWTFEPIMVSGSVAGFLAYADPASLTGDNIPMVWYEKNLDGSWTTWAWEQRDLGAGVRWVREAYGKPELLTGSPTLNSVVGGATTLVAPKSMVGGLYEDDPMQAVIEGAEDPAAAMSLLELIGWAAAPGLSTLAVVDLQDCTQATTIPAVEQMLNESAYKMEVILTGVATTLVDCFSACTGCITSYEAPVPSPGGSWQLCYEELPDSAPTQKICHYTYPGTQSYWNSGQELTCGTCTASGTLSVQIPGQSEVGREQPCQEPAYVP